MNNKYGDLKKLTKLFENVVINRSEKAKEISEKMMSKLLNSDTIQMTSARILDFDSEAYNNNSVIDFHISIKLQLNDTTPEEMLEMLNGGINRTLTQMAYDVSPELETTGNSHDKFEITHKSKISNSATFELNVSVPVF